MLKTAQVIVWELNQNLQLKNQETLHYTAHFFIAQSRVQVSWAMYVLYI